VALASSPLLPSGRNSILRAYTLLLYPVFYYCSFSSGRNTSVVLTSGPFLPSGYNSIFRANTPLLHSTFYYCSFSSGRNLLVILASYFFSWVASILLPSITNLFFWAAFYYSLVF
jgi:hypothetical protein